MKRSLALVLLGCSALSMVGATGGCAHPPCHTAATAPAPRDPSSAEAAGEDLARRGRYAEALEEFLRAFDQGAEAAGAYCISGCLIDTIVSLGAKYPPANVALSKRLESLALKVTRAADGGPPVDPADLLVFVQLGTKVGDEARVLTTYGIVRARLPVDAKLRMKLWEPIERYLVVQRRYREAAAEHEVSLASIRYTLAILKPHRTAESVRVAIVFTIEREGGTHFEALLGAGNASAAEELAEELIAFRPTGGTFAALIRHARRAGTSRVAASLHVKAYTVVPDTERKLVDDALNEPLKEPK